VLEGDTDGNGVANFAIDLTGNKTLTAADFVSGSLQIPLSLSGDGNANTLKGGAGNDTLNGNGGNDNLYGEAGNDNLDGGANEDTLIGAAGTDTLVGGDGNDVLEGDSEADVFTCDGLNNSTAAMVGMSPGDSDFRIDYTPSGMQPDTLGMNHGCEF
jgi:Ca2+-binding RTX toxin-like protein